MTGKYKQSAKRMINSMSDLLNDEPQAPKSTDTHLHKITKPEIHKPVKSQKEPTERLDAQIPQSLKWALEDHVKKTNRTRKRGNKTSMTAEIIQAIEIHLKNANY